MREDKLVSLCIPTYGVMEWVVPVIDSVYKQNVDYSLFEVVVTDNGNNEQFEQLMIEYCEKYSNLVYKKTTAYSFLNEIESYKIASGKLIKFINHRTLLLDGSLNKFIEFSKKYYDQKPCIYFSNGVLKFKEKFHEYLDFDRYVKGLSYYSSWSTGMTFWKEDFEKIINELNPNELFPHTDILFAWRDKNKYIIDDSVLLYEMPVSHANKGKYDLYYAFCVEYLNIILKLVVENSISVETFLCVKNDNIKFITELYFDFNVRKLACSYDLSSFNQSVSVFYSPRKIKKRIPFYFMRKAVKKMFGKKRRENYCENNI